MPLQNVIRLRFAVTNLACLFFSRPLSYCSLLLLSLSSLHSSLSPSLSTLLAIEYCSATCNFIIIIIKAHLMQRSFCVFIVHCPYMLSQVLERFFHRILLLTILTHNCPNTLAGLSSYFIVHCPYTRLS